MVEIIKQLKKILKGVSTLQNTAFNHHTRHEAGGGDEIATLVGVHHTTHENGGADEINVGGLSGELADQQKPKPHKASHQKGGADDLESLLQLANLAEKAHASLTGVGASDHHAKTTSAEIDHGSVQGLGDDDHTQYLHLNKVGQTLLQNLLVAAGKTVDGVDISKLPENIHQVVSSGGTTTSTSYVDLVSLGSKTFYGNKVLIMWSCNARNSTTPNGVQVGLFIDDVEDEDFRGKDHSVANNYYFTIGKQKIRTLSAGPHTIKLKYYAADAGTAETAHVMLIAIEFGS